MSDRLFTPRFFVMCGFTFTVFLSAFQLLPTAPFHIIDLGGSTFASGLFLGFLTYSSAFSAPLTGAFADRIGHRRMLLTSQHRAHGLLDRLRACITDYRVMLALAIVHGVFWSGLLSASAAYMTQPAAGAAPRRGHRLLGPVDDGGAGGGADDRVLDLPLRLGVAVRPVGGAEPRDGGHRLDPEGAAASPRAHERTGGLLEWRVLALSLTLFLYSFGYGGITSFTAMYADANGTSRRRAST